MFTNKINFKIQPMNRGLIPNCTLHINVNEGGNTTDVSCSKSTANGSLDYLLTLGEQ